MCAQRHVEGDSSRADGGVGDVDFIVANVALTPDPNVGISLVIHNAHPQDGPEAQPPMIVR